LNAVATESFVTDIVKQVVISGFSSLILNLLGQWTLTNQAADEKPAARKVYSIRATSVLIGVAIFLFWRWSSHDTESAAKANSPILQSVIAKPNFVKKGGRVTVTVQLDGPAPRGGVSVVLTSSDPAILTVDGVATVPAGRTMGTGYSEAVDVPTYSSPVSIIATYNDATVQTEVNVTKGDSTAQTPIYPQLPSRVNKQVSSPAPHDNSTALPTPPVRVPLEAELIGRLEEAEGRLTGEKGYWEGVKQHMPAGTSLRPEISSQLFAAESAVQRCERAKQASDAASLTPCVDALNDHLAQLRIQH